MLRGSRSLHFFMRLSEIEVILWEQADSLRLTLVLYGRSQRREVAIRPGTLLMSDGARAWHAFLAPGVSRELPDYNGIHHAEWGWIETLVPRETEDILEMSALRAMSLWWEPGKSWANPDDMPRQNGEVLTRFREVASAFRKNLRYPTWSYSIRTLPPATFPRRNIAHSSGAAEWFMRGKRLRQFHDGYSGFSTDGTIREDLTSSLLLSPESRSPVSTSGGHAA
jgi:hypothetical protein